MINKLSKNILLCVLAILLVGILVYLFMLSGKLRGIEQKSSRGEVCNKIANDYFKNVTANSELTEGNLEVAKNIESEIIDLCLIEPNQQTIGGYSSVNLNKYFNASPRASTNIPVKSNSAQQKTDTQLKSINSFEDCAAAGFPVMEVSPRRCRTSDGRSFTEK